MRRTSFVQPAILALTALFFPMAASISFGQTPYTPDIGNVGLPDNGTLHGTDIETVQLNNGNLHIDIPLLHLPGIGMDTDIHFTYDSQIWNHAIGPESNLVSNAPNWTMVTMSRPYWQLKDPMAGYLKWGEHTLNWNCSESTGSNSGNESNYDIDFVSFKDENGTAHSFTLGGVPPSGSQPLCSVPGQVGAFPSVDLYGNYEAYSLDQEGYRLVVNSSFAAPGNASPGVAWFTDKHGVNYSFGSAEGGASGLPAPLVGGANVGSGSVNGSAGPLNPAGPTGMSYAELSAVEDSDGNRITGAYNGTTNSAATAFTLTDTVNRTITETIGSPCALPQQTLAVSSESIGRTPCQISYLDQNNQTQTITITYGLTSSIAEVPLCSSSNSAYCGGSVNMPWSPGALVVPKTITLQNGDAYQFFYQSNGDPHYMGEITSITLPTGGTISYTWNGITDSGAGRYLTSRTVTDPVTKQTSVWKYNYGSGSGIVTVTDPNQNDTVYKCEVDPVEVDSNTTACYMTSEVSYSGQAINQNAIVTKTTGYTQVGASYMPTSEVVTWNSNNATAETDTTYDTFTPPYGLGNTTSLLGFGASNLTLGNVMSKIVYDYGTGSHGAVISNTQYAYLHQLNSAYVTQASVTRFPYIADRLAQVAEYNSATASSATLVAETNTAYDGSSLYSTASSPTAMHDYANYPAGYGLRGLPTSVMKYATASGGSTVTTSTVYNDLGKPVTVKDPNGNTTKFTYGAQNAFATYKVLPTVNSVTQQIETYYDPNTGLLMHSWDVNKNETSHTYDSRFRPLVTSRPDGGSTTISYPEPTSNPFPRTIVSVTTENVASSASTAATGNVPTSITSTTLLDGLGRKITASTGTSTNPIDTACVSLSVDTAYDPLGRVETVSNPHCVNANDTDGLTTYTYDAIGRLTAKQNPDGTSQNWSFNGNVISFFDETNRQWQHTYDAADRLVTVLEPANGAPAVTSGVVPTVAPTMETDYGYDALGNLLNVTQWGGLNGASNARTRSFAYDALSRLIAANNPETSGPSNPAAQTCAGASGSVWTSCYSYDNNGNLTQKVDNRGIAINYAYDALNRLTAKTYSDSTPSVAYAYDTSSVTGGVAKNDVGELTQATVTAGATVLARTIPYAYDPMGRLLNENQCTPLNCSGTPYAMAYTFDTMGKTTSATTPSSANGTAGQPLTLNFQYTQGRLNGATSSWSNGTVYPATLFSAPFGNTSPASYGPMGLLNASLGVTPTYPSGVLAIARAYDARGRVASEVDSAASGTGAAATASTGTITISGAEQTLSRTAKPGTALFTVTGSDGTTTVCSYQTVCNPSQTSCWQQAILPCPQVPNAGAMTATIWFDEFTPFAAPADYSGGSTDQGLATALATAFNASGAPVAATASGNSVTVTAIAKSSLNAAATGPSTNYPFTISNTGGGFGLGSASSSLSGGVTANPSDSGTISVTVSGNVTTIPFGAGSTPASLATALAAAINAQDGGYVTATASGAGVTLESVGDGTAVDWHLQESVTWDSADFATASFTAADNGMSGGVNSTDALYSYAIPATGGYDKNGNLLKVVDSVMGSWYYGYDNLNRLIAASAPVGQPSSVIASYGGLTSTWSYDPWGNRKSETETVPTGTNPMPTAAIPGTSSETYNTSNQVTYSSLNSGAGLTYDAAGDVTYDGLNSYLYDAEGRICAVKNSVGSITGYIYDAAGIRVARLGLGALSCNFAPGGVAWDIHASWALGQGGEQVAEFNGAGTWQHSNIFAGKLTGTYDTKGLHFYLDDWLGTRRVQTNSTGQLEMTCQSLPYGNGQNCITTSLTTADNPTEQFFTGKERDPESGDDYFEARYYNSAAGRFLSPDWSAKEEPVPYAKMDHPQTLNLYDYVRNSPLMTPDLDGHGCQSQCPDIVGDLARDLKDVFDGKAIVDTIRNKAQSLFSSGGGKVTTFGGTTDFTTTGTVGFKSVSSTGSESLSAVPGFGATLDVTVHKSGASSGPASVSGGEGLVSGEVTKSSVAVHVGPQVSLVPVKGGVNASVDADAAKSTGSTLGSIIRGFLVKPPALPKPPPPSCGNNGKC